MKLSNSCTRRDGRRPGVLLQLADSPAASDRGGVSPLSSPFDLNQLTHLLLTTAHPLPRPALCGRGVSPWSHCPGQDLALSRLRPEPKRPAEGKTPGEGGGRGRQGKAMERASPCWTLFSPPLAEKFFEINNVDVVC